MGEERRKKKKREEKKGNGILYPFISLSIFYNEGIIFFPVYNRSFRRRSQVL